MLTSVFSFSNGRMPVASPSSVCSRQTKPGAASATALIRSRFAAKSAITGESIGALDDADVQLGKLEGGHENLLALCCSDAKVYEESRNRVTLSAYISGAVDMASCAWPASSSTWTL